MRHTVAIVLILLIAGCAGAATPTEEPTPREPPAVDYTFEPDCHDHVAVSGEYIQDCSAELTVHELPENVEMVRLRMSNSYSKQAYTWRVDGTGFGTGGHVYAIEYPNGQKPMYGDLVTITALTEDGREHVLEKHVFSCEDVAYKDACSSNGGKGE